MQREREKKESVFVVRLGGGIDLPSSWLTFLFPAVQQCIVSLPHTFIPKALLFFLFFFFFLLLLIFSNRMRAEPVGFNAQPCSSSRLAVRCCPSTTRRSSSSSPAVATCRFLISALVSLRHKSVWFACQQPCPYAQLRTGEINLDRTLVQVFYSEVTTRLLHALKISFNIA